MKTVNLNSISVYHDLYGLHTQHPLVTVVDLKEATRGVNHIRMSYGIYALFLKNGVQCSLRYGRRSYDYQEGTVVSFAPGQVVDVEMIDETIGPDVIGLLFHPDLIYGTPLAEKIGDFGFFDYSQNEALHLSESERQKFLFLLSLIKEEISRPVDHHSASVISANIQLLLEHLDRFYDRQFITRHRVNSDVVANFERQLKEYYRQPKAGTPTVSYFAERASLSLGYFGDLIKKETGTTAKDLIALHIINEAKRRLASTSQDISIIAYDLGFEYPAHFTRMFKRITGVSPSAYRAALA